MTKKKVKPLEYDTLDIEAQRMMLNNFLRQFEEKLFTARANFKNQSAQLEMLESNKPIPGTPKPVREAQKNQTSIERANVRLQIEILLTNITTTQAELAKLPPPPADKEEGEE